MSNPLISDDTPFALTHPTTGTRLVFTPILRAYADEKLGESYPDIDQQFLAEQTLQERQSDLKEMTYGLMQHNQCESEAELKSLLNSILISAWYEGLDFALIELERITVTSPNHTVTMTPEETV